MTKIYDEINKHETFLKSAQKIANVSSVVETEKVFEKLAVTFKVLGDVTRTKIIFCLMKKEQCVNDLTDRIGVSQSAVSHQLRVLRNLDLVTYRKNGKTSYYSLNDEHIRHLFEEGLKHVKEKLGRKK